MTAFFLLTSGIWLVLELIFTSHGLMIACLPCYVFYVAGAWGWKRGIAAAIFLGLISDLVMGNFFPFRIFLYTLIACCSCWSVRKLRGAHFFDLILPGALIPLIVWMLPALFCPLPAFLEVIQFILPVCFINALVLPLTVWILDSIAGKINLRRFAGSDDDHDGEAVL